MAKWICEDCGKEEESYGKVIYRRCPSCDLENLFLIAKQIKSSSPCSDGVIKPEDRKEQEVGPNEDGCEYGAIGGWCEAPDDYECYSKLKQDDGSVGCLEAL